MLNHISHVKITVFVIVLIELDVVNFVIVGVGFVTVDFGVAVAVTNVLLLHFSSHSAAAAEFLGSLWQFA